MKAMVFVRYLESCRETHYAPCWECKTGNVLTRSVISAEQAIKRHTNKLTGMGMSVREIIYRED